MVKQTEGPRYQIRVVSEKTGLSPHVIRVWERRYDAVTPQRSPNGYRQYTEADIDRLRCLRELTEAGHAIGDVAGLGDDALAELLDQHRAVAGPPRGVRLSDADAGLEEGAPSELTVPVARASVDRAMRSWDAGRLTAVLREAAVRLPLDIFLEEVLIDLLHGIGHEWEAGRLRPGREHMVSAALPGILDWTADRLPESEPDAPLAVFATPAGTRHDLGARVAALIARDAGWGTLFLGGDLPAAEIARAGRENDARLVGLSIVYPGHDPAIRAQLEALAADLDGETALVVGGAAAPSYAETLSKQGVEIVGTLTELRERLASAA